MHTYNQYQVTESVSVSSYWVIQTSVWHDRKKLLTILKRKIVWCCFWNLVSTNSQNYLERFPESKPFRNFRLCEIMLKILGNHLNSFRAMYPLARKKEYVHTVVSSARDTEGLYYPWHIFFPQRVNHNIGILQWFRNY